MRVETALVVDDSKVVQFKLRRMLEARGLEVDVVGSGHESLDYLKINLPDVIFMDFMMADMDGYEVTGMITANPETSAIPVIICTGHDTPQDRERARNSRARGFVTKPVDDATLDALLVQLRQGVAAIAPVAAPAPVATATPIAAPTPVAALAPVATHAPIRVSEVPATEDIARIVERIAREVVERLVRDATAALSAGSEQAARRVAQAVANEITHDALASWRTEVANTNERAELVAITAATGVAREIAQHARDEADVARRSNESTYNEKLQETLASVQPIAERAARETLESAKAAMEEASQQVLESVRAELQESVRITAEAAAKPAAETAARAVSEHLVRVSLAAAREDEALMRSDVEQAATAAAERAAREIAEQAISEAEAARQIAAAAADEKLQERLATVQPTAERAAREAVESARAVMEEASRDVLESAKAAMEEASHQVEASLRADLQESVRIAAEAAARPAAETTGRAVAEQILQVSLAAAREDEAASRRQLEERAIVVAERVGRELVKLAFDAATAKGQPGAGESEVLEGKTSDQTAMTATATPERPVRNAWAATPGLLPWLAAVTLGVLYLLTRNYF